MYQVKTLNAISDIYREYLQDTEYDVGAEVENPQAIIVRSADMHGIKTPDSLLAVARAGAGTNNKVGPSRKSRSRVEPPDVSRYRRRSVQWHEARAMRRSERYLRRRMTDAGGCALTGTRWADRNSKGALRSARKTR